MVSAWGIFINARGHEAARIVESLKFSIAYKNHVIGVRVGGRVRFYRTLGWLEAYRLFFSPYSSVISKIMPAVAEQLTQYVSYVRLQLVHQLAGCLTDCDYLRNCVFY